MSRAAGDTGFVIKTNCRFFIIYMVVNNPSDMWPGVVPPFYSVLMPGNVFALQAESKTKAKPLTQIRRAAYCRGPCLLLIFALTIIISPLFDMCNFF